MYSGNGNVGIGRVTLLLEFSDNIKYFSSINFIDLYDHICG